MKEQNPEKLFHLYCQKHGEFWSVYLGPGWVPASLRPFFDEHFESERVLLDFEYMEHLFKKRGQSCEIKEATNGSKELTARGDAASALARWLGTSLSSAMVQRGE